MFKHGLEYNEFRSMHDYAEEMKNAYLSGQIPLDTIVRSLRKGIEWEEAPVPGKVGMHMLKNYSLCREHYQDARDAYTIIAQARKKGYLDAPHVQRALRKLEQSIHEMYVHHCVASGLPETMARTPKYHEELFTKVARGELDLEDDEDWKVFSRYVKSKLEKARRLIGGEKKTREGKVYVEGYYDKIGVKNKLEELRAKLRRGGGE